MRGGGRYIYTLNTDPTICKNRRVQTQRATFARNDFPFSLDTLARGHAGRIGGARGHEDKQG